MSYVLEACCRCQHPHRRAQSSPRWQRECATKKKFHLLRGRAHLSGAHDAVYRERPLESVYIIQFPRAPQHLPMSTMIVDGWQRTKRMEDLILRMRRILSPPYNQSSFEMTSAGPVCCMGSSGMLYRLWEDVGIVIRQIIFETIYNVNDIVIPPLFFSGCFPAVEGDIVDWPVDRLLKDFCERMKKENAHLTFSENCFYLFCLLAWVDTPVSKGEIAVSSWELPEGMDRVVVEVGMEVPVSGVSNLYFQQLKGNIVKVVAVKKQLVVFCMRKENVNAH